MKSYNVDDNLSLYINIAREKRRKAELVMKIACVVLKHKRNKLARVQKCCEKFDAL